jgi:hypothetical protein
VLPMYRREISLPLSFNIGCKNSDVSNSKFKFIIFELLVHLNSTCMSVYLCILTSSRIIRYDRGD